MKNVVIHAGPPKTGTTSIQTFLQESSLSRVCYLGVFQPRHENKSRNRLRDKIYAYINGGHDEVSKIQDFIEDTLEDKEVAIFSEEMILHGLNWKSKINRLYNIFGQFDPRVSVCLRDPKDALPSYYQEIYSNVDKHLRSEFRKFTNSEYGEIYDYREVEKCFESSGFQDISFFSFDDLTAGRLSPRDLGIEGVPDAGVRMSLPKDNKSKKDRRGYRVIKANRMDEIDNLFSTAVGLLRKLGSPGRYFKQKIRSMMEVERKIKVGSVGDKLSEIYEDYRRRIP